MELPRYRLQKSICITTHQSDTDILQKLLMLVKHQRPPRLFSEAFVFCIESGTVLSFRDLVVRDAFAVGLELPCSEEGERWIC